VLLYLPLISPLLKESPRRFLVPIASGYNIGRLGNGEQITTLALTT
jgi:hypothetical protein